MADILAKDLDDRARENLVDEVLQLWAFLEKEPPDRAHLHALVNQVLDANPAVINPFPSGPGGRPRIASRFDEVMSAIGGLDASALPPT